jgi:redox-sensitive bicupin YhaK (pirin superfamily)
MKKLAFIHRSTDSHWVGDGFPVKGVFNYTDIAQEMSPFLLMDYAAPYHFTPTTTQKRGVGEHPHRGFETVTIVYEGEVTHRDSSGGGGTIGPGDVQWMTAGSGLVHEEFHGKDYAKRGGPFEMVQLWVNLPKKDKMTAPGYQGITSAQIPEVLLDGDAGKVRVIAGSFRDRKGPARTFTAMHVWDVRLAPGGRADLAVDDGFTASVFVLKGRVKLGTGEVVGTSELALLERSGTAFSVEADPASGDAKLLVLSGKPLDEPIVGRGPFVMNTEGEIRQAILDFQSGRMGRL